MARPRRARKTLRVRVPKQARSRRTRRRILEAALDCFQTFGFDETTTARIAERAEIGVGTLYAYFRDKREILLELLDTTAREVADAVVLALEPEAWRGGDRRELARKLLESVFEASRLRPGLQRILWERYFRDPELQASVEAIEMRVRGAIERLLVTLQREGAVRRELDVPSAAFAVYAAVQWMATRLVLGGADAERTARAVNAATEMISRFLFGAAEAS